MKETRILVGLDIGTTKICTVIGELMSDGSLDIIGEGTVFSDVMKKGTVVNLERTTAAIRQSIALAERVAGVTAHEVFVSVSGPHIKALTSHGLAAIRRNQEIRKEDVERAIENAQAVDLGNNLEVIHTQPQEFRIDGQEGIKNPVGMQGVRLEVDVHIVAGASGPLANLRRCVTEAGIIPKAVVLQSYASGLAVLEGQELENTVVVIDIGGGSTDIGVFRRGNLAHSAVLPVGSDHISGDLSQLFKIPLDEASRIKKKYGSAVPELTEPDVTLEITQPSSTLTVRAFDLATVIRPRVAEIFDLVRKEIDDNLGPMEMLASSVVLTGGGSMMRGMVELARDRFRLPVRIGVPQDLGGIADIVESPIYATAVGLLHFNALQNPIRAGNTGSGAGTAGTTSRSKPSSNPNPGLSQNPSSNSTNSSSSGQTLPQKPAPIDPKISAVDLMIETPNKVVKPPPASNPNAKAGVPQKGWWDKLKDLWKDFF